MRFARAYKKIIAVQENNRTQGRDRTRRYNGVSRELNLLVDVELLKLVVFAPFCTLRVELVLAGFTKAWCVHVVRRTLVAFQMMNQNRTCHNTFQRLSILNEAGCVNRSCASVNASDKQKERLSLKAEQRYNIFKIVIIHLYR